MMHASFSILIKGQLLRIIEIQLQELIVNKVELQLLRKVIEQLAADSETSVLDD